MKILILIIFSFQLLAASASEDNPEFLFEYSDTELPIAVIDTGIDYNHERLRNHIAPEIGYDFLHSDKLPYDFQFTEKSEILGKLNNSKTWNQLPQVPKKILTFVGNIIDNYIDSFGKPGHGTCVSDVIVQNSLNDVAIANFRWAPREDSRRQTINALQRAVNQSYKIINLSLGTNFRKSKLEDDIELQKFNAFKEKFIEIIEANPDKVFIVAAGNEGESLTSWDMEAIPAKINRSNVITVGALNADGDIAYFSNYGSVHTDVYALGHEIECAKAQGGLTKMNGTSFAAPYVAAKFRDFWLQNPKLDAKKAAQSYLKSLDKKFLSFADYPKGFPKSSKNAKPWFTRARVDR